MEDAMPYPVQAPQNTTPAYSGTFIPTLWSSKLIVKLYATTVFGEIANTDYEGEIKSMGDKIIMLQAPSVSINPYTVGQNLVYEVLAPNKVEMDIDKGNYFGVNISDVYEVQSAPNLMDMFTNDASKQMAIAIDREALKYVVGTADPKNMGGTAGQISSGYSLGTDAVPIALNKDTIVGLITSMAAALDEQNVPETDRWLLVSPRVRNTLVNSELKQAYLTGDAQSTIRNGKIGMIDRFTIYVSNLMPQGLAGFNFDGTVNAGAVAREAMLGGHKMAITWASQIDKVESLPNPTDFGTLVRGLCVYGRKTIKPQALVLGIVTR